MSRNAMAVLKPAKSRPPAVLLVVCPEAAEGKKRKMFSSTAEAPSTGKFEAAVVTVSDSCARGERVDLSGPAVAQALGKSGFQVVAHEIVSDDSMRIQNALILLAGKARLV